MRPSKPAELERVELQDARRSRERETDRPESESRPRPDYAWRKSVFDERDVAKILHRYIDDPALFKASWSVSSCTRDLAP